VISRQLWKRLPLAIKHTYPRTAIVAVRGCYVEVPNPSPETPAATKLLIVDGKDRSLISPLYGKESRRYDRQPR